MSVHFQTLIRATAALMIGAGVLFANDRPDGNTLLTQAEARVGRPLTPMSYAGVARRTTRRTVAVGAATAGAVAVGTAAVVAAPVVVTPACVQAVDVYGRIYTRCY
jgi:hypothetical protein